MRITKLSLNVEFHCGVAFRGRVVFNMVKSSCKRQKHAVESIAPAKAEERLHGHAGFPRSF
ncbi:hypothetical protein JOD03_000284 [Chryseomicrobium aureum]|nr:hypothetical protein [Chryseomicrobium aureum]